MKITEKQLREAIKEEMQLQEVNPLALKVGAQAAMAVLNTKQGRKMVGSALKAPDALMTKFMKWDDAALAALDLKTPNIVNDIQAFSQALAPTGILAKLGEFIEGVDEQDMQTLTKAAVTGDLPGATAADRMAAGVAPAVQAVVPQQEGQTGNKLHLTTERFKQIVQEELARTTQMERKLK